MERDSREAMADMIEQLRSITTQCRIENYGPPEENHARCAALWNSYLQMIGPRALSGRDVCWMMCLLKMSRDENRRIPDNALDVAGYAINAGVCG